jgi:autotransporter-associated beta strand protein
MSDVKKRDVQEVPAMRSRTRTYAFLVKFIGVACLAAVFAWMLRGNGRDSVPGAPATTVGRPGGAASAVASATDGRTAAQSASGVPTLPGRSAPVGAPATNAVGKTVDTPVPGTPDVRVASAGIKDRYADCTVIDEITTPGVEPGRRVRVRVVKTDMKYPFVRVEDVWEVSVRGAERLVSQTAMVADHVTVKVKAGTTEADLAAFAQAHGGTILRKLRTPGPGLYIVKFDQAMVDTVPKALAAFGLADGPVVTATPDYIVYHSETIPNDPMFAKLWGMHNIGQIVGSSGAVQVDLETIGGAPLDHSPATPGVFGTLHTCGLGSPEEFPAEVNGNIALIERGSLTFVDKVANAMAAGATAVIIYNNEEGEFAGTLVTDGPWIPTLGVSQEDGWNLLGYVGDKTAKVTIDGSMVDADIDAPEAWDLETGTTNIVVGVIDTGVDHTHPDLAPNIWTNPGEIPGNGIDDDSNGFIDDVHGYDFQHDDGDPMDDHFHGTHCAGTIGAVGNNGVGVAGVCWNVRIMALKFLGPNGGANSDAIEAIYYATANGAKLTSNSWGGGGFDQNLFHAIQDAANHDIAFIAAAGNSAQNNDVIANYPSNYETANMVAVAALDSNDKLASFSCYGATTVDIGAPGVNILSTFPTTQTDTMAANNMATHYGTISGTSMATPHVSGVYALLASRFPSVPMPTLRDWLLRQAVPIPALQGACATGGRLNAVASLNLSQEPFVQYDTHVASDAAGNNDGWLNPGETISLDVTLRNLGLAAATGLQGTLSCTDSNVTITDNANAFPATGGYGTLTSADNAFAFSIATNCPTPRDVTFSLAVSDDGGHSWTNTFTMTFYRSSTVEGHVVMATGGAGIAGATVSYSGTLSGTVTTDASGAYQISLIDGTYELFASASTYLNSDPQTLVLPPSHANVDFAMGSPVIDLQPAGTITLSVEEGASVDTGIQFANTGDARLRWGLRGKTTPLKNPGTIVRQFYIPNEIRAVQGLSYDGSSLWLTDYPFPAVYRLDPTDGRILSARDLSGTVSPYIQGIHSDGDFLYLSEWPDYDLTDSVSIAVIDARTGALVRRIPYAPGAPNGLGMGEGSLWAADFNDGQDLVTGGPSGRAQWAKRIDPETGAQLSKVLIPTAYSTGWDFQFGQVYGLTYLNGSVWTVSAQLATMPDGPFSKADPDTGALIKQFDIGPYYIYNLSSDGLRRLWCADFNTRTIYCIDSGEVAWLRTTTDGGLLAPGASTSLGVTADAGVLNPGTYNGTVRVVCTENPDISETRQVSLTVTDAPRFTLVSSAVNDAEAPAVGDGDGSPEPGETVALTLRIKNNGHADATSLTATLITTGETSVQSGVIGFPDAAVGATVASTAPFVVTIPPDLTNCVQSFDLELIDGTGRIRNVPLTIAITRKCRMTGTVTGAVSGLPLAGARIEVDAREILRAEDDMISRFTTTYTAVTAADGSYTIDAISAGTRRVTVNCGGYAESEVNVAFLSDEIIHDVQLVPPAVAVSPASLTQTLQAGQTVTQTVTIANSGTLPLAWSLTTGSDGFSVSTSDQPGGPAYNWIEISSTGTRLPYLGGNIFVSAPQGPFNLGFAFPFYGDYINSFWFARHYGYLCFDGEFRSQAAFCRPNGHFLLPLATANWAGYQKVSATKMVAEMKRGELVAGHWGSAQVHMEADGRISYHYRRVYDFRNEVQTWVQDVTQTQGRYVIQDKSQLHDEFAVMLTPTADWLSMSPSAGTAGASGVSTVTVTFDATDMAAGTYIMNLQAVSHDPAAPVINIPVTLTVTGGKPTFDGGLPRANTAWGTAANWAGDTLPTFDNQADVVFEGNYLPASGATAFDTYIGVNRTVRSITVKEGTSPRINVRPHDGGTTARVLTFDADTGNPYVSHAGNDLFVLGNGTGAYGSFSLAKTLDVAVTSDAGMSINRPMDGAGGLTKSGSGTLTFGGTSVSHGYSGDTLVRDGVLLFTANKTGTGGITVGGSAATGTPTLRGTATLSGPVTIAGANGGEAGILAPGTATATGTLMLNNKNLSLETGAKLAFRLGTASDKVAGVATLALNGQQWSDFAFTINDGFGVGVYVLIQATNVVGGLGAVVSGDVGDLTGILGVDANADVVLTVTYTGATYIVSYDANGAESGTAPDMQTKLDGVDLTLATNSGNLAKTNFMFSGWNTDADGTGTDYAAGGTYTANAALTLYAKWTEAGAETYNWDGSASGGWGNGNNWVENAITWGNRTDLIFYSAAANLSTFLGSGGDRTIRSLTFNDDADSNVDIRLTTTSGGTTAANLTFNGGGSGAAITVAAGATAGQHIIGAGGVTGQIILNDNLVIDHNGSGVLAFGRIITGNYSVTKNGTGQLSLARANNNTYSYSGGFIMNDGSLQTASASGFGTGTVTFNGGTIKHAPAAVITLANNVVVADSANVKTLQNGSAYTVTYGGAFTLDETDAGGFKIDVAGTGNLLLDGLISGDGGIEKTGAGTGFLRLGGGGANTYAGITRVTGGELRLNNLGAIQNSPLDTGGSGVIAATAGAGNYVIGGLISGRDLASVMTGNPANVTALTLNPLDGAATYTNVIGDLSTGMAVVKTGVGTQVLGGGNTYTGTTTVNGGTLVVNGTQTSATGAITVGGDGTADAPTLRGTGTLGGDVTIKSAGTGVAGTLAPGDVSSAGTLNLNSTALTLESGAQLKYRLGTTSDSVAGVTTLALNGQEWNDFTFTAGDGFGPGTYVLIAADSVTGALGATVEGSVGAYTGALSVDGTHDLVLTVGGTMPLIASAMVTDGAHFTISIDGSGACEVQASTNLLDPNAWMTLSSNTAPFRFTDTNAMETYPRRFYRAWVP